MRILWVIFLPAGLFLFSEWEAARSQQLYLELWLWFPHLSSASWRVTWPVLPARLITRYANAPAGSTGQHTHSRRLYVSLVISSLYLYFDIIFFYIEIRTTYYNNKHPSLLLLYHIFMSLILLYIQYIVSKYHMNRVICYHIDCVIERTSRGRWDFGNVTILPNYSYLYLSHIFANSYFYIRFTYLFSILFLYCIKVCSAKCVFLFAPPF